jgi:hypothetical protein
LIAAGNNEYEKEIMSAMTDGGAPLPPRPNHI